MERGASCSLDEWRPWLPFHLRTKLFHALPRPSKCTLTLGKLFQLLFLKAHLWSLWRELAETFARVQKEGSSCLLECWGTAWNWTSHLSDFQIQAELVAKPSASLEFVTNMGIIIPDFAKSGVQMNTNFFHESGLEARVALKAGQLKVIIPSPKRPVKLFSGR